MLKLFNIKKKFGGIKAADNCNFRIKKNKITAIIGPNGSGKTTIFNIISGVERADSGKIMFLGKDITNNSIEKIANLGISRLYQQPSLFDNLTVKENLSVASNKSNSYFWKNFFFPKRFFYENKVNEYLNLLNILKLKNKKTDELSFGQKRLVEIARTLIAPHNLLMLDEPVTGVNPKLKKDIAKLLLHLKAKGETILFIEHDMEFTLKIADHLIVLNQGKVIARGTPDTIKKNIKVRKVYLGY